MYKFVKPSSLTSVNEVRASSLSADNEEKGKLMVFLIHPGGPFWEKKDYGVWGIPKGEQDDPGHDLFDVAKREFCEETSIDIPDNVTFIPLGNIKQKNGKIVHAWAFENNEKFLFKCTSYVEHYGQKTSSVSSDTENSRFCEVDKGEFFSVEEARKKILPSQWELVERLIKVLNIKDINEKQVKLGV